MAKRIGGVYRIVAPNGECYIGSSNYVARRWGQHLGALGRGTHASRKLQAVADVFGCDALRLEVLYSSINDPELWRVEQQFIDELRPALNKMQSAKCAMHFAATVAKAKGSIAKSSAHATARIANQKLAAQGVARRVVCLSTGEKYDSSYAAARAVGVTHLDSMAAAINKGWRCGGMYWAWDGSGITLAQREAAAAEAELKRRQRSAANMTETKRRAVRRETDGQVFYSIAEAARQVGCHHTAIHRAANTGMKANGSRWSYA